MRFNLRQCLSKKGSHWEKKPYLFIIPGEENQSFAVRARLYSQYNCTSYDTPTKWCPRWLICFVILVYEDDPPSLHTRSYMYSEVQSHTMVRMQPGQRWQVTRLSGDFSKTDSSNTLGLDAWLFSRLPIRPCNVLYAVHTHEHCGCYMQHHRPKLLEYSGRLSILSVRYAWNQPENKPEFFNLVPTRFVILRAETKFGKSFR